MIANHITFESLKNFSLLVNDPTKRMAENRKPVSRHLKILELSRNLGKPIIEILSQPWPELKTFSFEEECFDGISNKNIEEVLQKNPQLRALLLRNCRNIRFDRVILSMAIQTPLIEHFRFVNSEILDFLGDGTLSELKNLKSLDIHIGNGSIKAVLSTLDTANSSLEHLSANFGRFYVHAQFRAQIVQTLMSFMKLKTLWLLNFFHGFRVSDMINIVENSVELGRFKLNGCFMNGDNLLELIRKGENIQKLDILEGCFEGVVNINVFHEVVNIVQNRRDKIHLEVVLWSKHISVPADLLKAHSEHVTFVIRPCTRSLCETDETIFGFY